MQSLHFLVEYENFVQKWLWDSNNSIPVYSTLLTGITSKVSEDGFISMGIKCSRLK